jgi:hypothetical protein
MTINLIPQTILKSSADRISWEDDELSDLQENIDLQHIYCPILTTATRSDKNQKICTRQFRKQPSPRETLIGQSEKTILILSKICTFHACF